MKLSLACYTLILTVFNARSSPVSPPRNPSSHYQDYDYQTNVNSPYYVPPEFHQMSLTREYTAPPDPPVVQGFEHLLHHLTPEMNPYEIHQTEHYGLTPGSYLYEHLNQQGYTPNNAEQSDPYHWQSTQHSEGSSRRHTDKGKHVMHSENEMRSNNFQEAEDLVNSLYHDTTFDHEPVYNPRSDLEEEKGEIRDDQADSSDDEIQEEVEKRRAKGPPRKEGSNRDTLAKKEALFRQIWNAKGLSTEMDPEELAGHVALWRAEGIRDFDNHSIGSRAVKMIGETKPEDIFPEYLASYTEYTKELAIHIMRVRRKMDREQRYLELKTSNKKLYDMTAVKKAINSVQQSRFERRNRLTSRASSIDDDPKYVEVIQALKGHLEAQDVDIDKADLHTLIDEGFNIRIKGINNWNIIQYIKDYLLEERKFDEDEIKIFMRQARLKNSNVYYHTHQKDAYNKSRRKAASQRQ